MGVATMKRFAFAFTALLLMLGCKNGNLPTPQGRFEIRKISGETVQFVPTASQLPYCLIFTQSKDGTLRQMTMSNENRSVHCPPGQPVMGLTFRIPVSEGPVKVLAFFSDQKLTAASVAQQLLESPDGSPMDLRAPGTVNAQVIEFTPTREPGPQQGGVVAQGGQLTLDGGVSQPVVPPAGKVTGLDGGLEKPSEHP